ncbi:hypothetical protein SERLADRAFT_478659 [Serpula lacrymans var. lacrymans S7.9]|uniref:SMODS and SLOG-associating 2TM effector domain-containing protein n=1 Tax=Serpula lacrymans var. lacrymans (strain S7.9) TaxID=578457 RepID=F8PA39_SERL9|nr:uncharacterized protein SERLADRAFT_478659 [Serpula lacrymans var. lacrymans S7.9]EGO20036.1 hypothetical protein SERLADRAFT_478659 [Serpula lacrymans var. lacrymans S7.9]
MPPPTAPVRNRSVREAHPYPTVTRAPSRRPTLVLDESVRTSRSRRTLEDRLEPTLRVAEAEKEKFAQKALWTGYALNVAIGLQVLLGALTTAIASATIGKQTSIATAILGGLSTLVASYLARARGSNEPEASITRVKDLEQFIRDCQAFVMDHGTEYGEDKPELNKRVEEFRRRFEELLGNFNTERHPSSAFQNA